MRAISEIIVHCTATRPEWFAGKTVKAKVAEIDRWHKANGWKGIGYHYLIDRDGALGVGRDLNTVGAHVKDHNIGSVGVALIGGHGAEATDHFEDHFTPEQDAALRNLIADLRVRFGDLIVSGHNQYAAKGCPGFYAPGWFERAEKKAVEATPAPAPQPDPQESPIPVSGSIFALIARFFEWLAKMVARK